jgi:hypothetical protein
MDYKLVFKYSLLCLGVFLCNLWFDWKLGIVIILLAGYVSYDER